MDRKIVAVHDGVFHADDVFAVASLKRIFAVEIVRTRDPEKLKRAEMCVDVGGGTFDHHMPSGAGARGNGVPYAAFGLVWREFGERICESWRVAAMVDKRLIQPVDSGDTGFAMKQANGDSVYNVSNVISRMNPEWYEEPQDFDATFAKAVEFAGVILDREISHYRGMLLADAEVEATIAATEDKRLIVLKRFCPWFRCVARQTESLYVLFPDTIGGGWRMQCVPKDLNSRDKRRPMPTAWAGKNGDEFARLTGVDDATFCHPARFIAGARSKEGILALAKLALAD